MEMFEGPMLIELDDRVVQIDADVLEWFQGQDGDYGELINSALRRHIEQQQQQQIG